MSRMTRGQLIDQALQRVGNNSVSLKWQARVRLNRILQDLHRGWDWPFLWTVAPISISSAGTLDLTTLPLEFVKPEDDQSLMVLTVAGNPVRRPMQEVDHKTFAMLRTGFIEVASGTVPRVWTIDYTTNTGRTWPAAPAACELRYKYLPADVAVDPIEDQNGELYDADTPTFPWDAFLTDALLEWAMAYEADPRRAEQLTINEEMFKRWRGATWPERSFPSFVQLDPLVFSTPTWGSGRSD